MAETLGRDAGGIARLSRALDEHRAAFAYDWRARFGVPSSTIGESMDWAEACALTAELLKDPSSHVTAALNGWRYPWSAESFILADLFDLYLSAHTKRRPSPRPRPYDRTPEIAARPSVVPSRVLDELRKRGHLHVIKEA